MIRIHFTAKRALVGHAIGDQVTLTFSAVEPLVASRKVTREVQKSLSGRRETLLYNGLREWDVTTEPVQGAKLDLIEEFLQAVEDGTSFEFEPYWSYGAEAADQSASETRLRTSPTVSCVLVSEQYDLAHFAGNGNGGADDWYQVRFTVGESK